MRCVSVCLMCSNRRVAKSAEKRANLPVPCFCKYRSNLQLVFIFFVTFFEKKGNTKKLHKGSKKLLKVFFGSFFYRKKERMF
jgi:hypothetical protein